MPNYSYTDYITPSDQATISDFGGVGSSTAPSPSKPGFDYLAAGAGLQDLFGGVGDLIRGIRGEAPRMAGSRLQEYLQTQRQESYLADLLKSIVDKSTKEADSFNPLKGLLL
ncbi:MAG: hypothetical protein FJ184_00115 [Gammaproteobacteria bacterium]|nr:hypothetical protein [Gammaproteobacteria bacterium]